MLTDTHPSEFNLINTIQIFPLITSRLHYVLLQNEHTNAIYDAVHRTLENVRNICMLYQTIFVGKSRAKRKFIRPKRRWHKMLLEYNIPEWVLL
jgi:hypothetical protein